uniref:Uncharacterized protein n=1 Tax=Oryza meridionalis TaxID=40149 RepID=A0A0E0BZ89_9ORYZ
MGAEQAPEPTPPLPPPPPPPPPPVAAAERGMGFAERAVAAAGAAVVSAVLVNPLDVAKTRLQAQAAGVVYNPIWSDFRCYPWCNPGMNGLGPSCSSECFQYRGTMDVFYKVTKQEGVFRLWRGTAASLALAVPTVGIYLPSYDLLRNWIEEYSDHSFPKLRPYAPLIAGSVARSLACITCSPIELARTRMQFGHTTFYGLVSEHNLHVTSPSQLYAGQFLNHKEGISGIFRGAGPRMARAGPSVGIVVSSYEVVKHLMHRKHAEL